MNHAFAPDEIKPPRREGRARQIGLNDVNVREIATSLVCQTCRVAEIDTNNCCGWRSSSDVGRQYPRAASSVQNHAILKQRKAAKPEGALKIPQSFTRSLSVNCVALKALLLMKLPLPSKRSPGAFGSNIGAKHHGQPICNQKSGITCVATQSPRNNLRFRPRWVNQRKTGAAIGTTNQPQQTFLD